MGSITDSLEIDLLDHVCNDVSYTPPATCYLCLCTADPTDAATGASMNEVANLHAYQRTAIAFAAAASRSVDQSGDVDFPQASGGSWGTVSHWAIASVQTYGTGQALAHGAFADSKLINDGNTPSVASGQIDVTFAANECSDALAIKLLDRAFRNQAYAVPDTYAALCTAIIDDTKTGSTITEPGSNYARKQVNPADWTAAAAGALDNSAEIAFITATGDWTTIVAVALCSALTAGDVLFYDNAMTDQAVGNGDTAKFPIGDLDVTLS